jgi:hypothetical protein
MMLAGISGSEKRSVFVMGQASAVPLAAAMTRRHTLTHTLSADLD